VTVAVAVAVAVGRLLAVLLPSLLPLLLPLRWRVPALGESHGSVSPSGCAVAQLVTAGKCAGTIQPEGAATVMGLPSIGVAEAPPGSPGFWLVQALYAVAVLYGLDRGAAGVAVALLLVSPLMLL
jgi:hypothetical protein